MGDQKINYFPLDDPQKVQDRGRTEFPISAGNGLATGSLIQYFSSLS